MSGGARFALAVLCALAALAVLAPLVAIEDPSALRLEENLASPSLDHPLGQDRLGRDVWSRLVYGARVSLVVGFATVLLSVLLGTTIGLVAGVAGGWLDEAAMRVVDVLLAFPGLLLAIALTAVLGPSVRNVVIALAVIGWTGFARLVRAEALSIRGRPHFEAARALGAGPARLVVLHVFPLLATPLTVQATFALAGAIAAEAGLSFLGLGVQPPTASWGAMLNEGRAFLLVAPHVALVPATAIFATVLAINVLGDALRDRLGAR